MNRFALPLGYTAALVVSFLLWANMDKFIGHFGEEMKKAGPLVAFLIFLLILQIAYVFERMWSLKKAQGKGSLPLFLNNVRKSLKNNDVDGAIKLCNDQRGSAANVMRAGLERYRVLRIENAPKDKVQAETQAAIQEAAGLETPLLERNLIALSTIASIGTMVGLLGTTVGMIRSFAALGTSGAVDASKLAIGISEALVNTAGGLAVAIIGIVMYNVFVTTVDSFNYMIDEASYEVLQLITAKAAENK